MLEFKIPIVEFAVLLDLLCKIGFDVGKACYLGFKLCVHVIGLGNGFFEIMNALIKIPLIAVLLVCKSGLLNRGFDISNLFCILGNWC